MFGGGGGAAAAAPAPSTAPAAAPSPTTSRPTKEKPKARLTAQQKGALALPGAAASRRATRRPATAFNAFLWHQALDLNAASSSPEQRNAAELKKPMQEAELNVLAGRLRTGHPVNGEAAHGHVMSHKRGGGSTSPQTTNRLSNQSYRSNTDRSEPMTVWRGKYEQWRVVDERTERRC